jgi:integrase
VPEARRARGSGGLYQRASDGMWVAAISLPTTDGTRRRKVITRAKKADAIKELRKLRQELEHIGDLRTSSPTLSTWLDVWWKRYAMKNLKVSSRDVYRSRIEQYIRPSIGGVRLDRLAPEHVHRLHDYVTVTKGLSITTARGAHRVLSSVLADALTEDKVARNVCLVVKAPKPAAPAKQKGRALLASAQARTLLASLDPGDGTVSLPLASCAVRFFAGLRQGERNGLTRDAIDFEAGTITVSWQLKRLAYEHGCGEKGGDGKWPCGRKQGGFCPSRHLDVPEDQEVRHVEGGLYLIRPKSKAGWRVIPMLGILAEILRQYLKTHQPGTEGLIFTRPNGPRNRGASDGRPIDPGTDNAAWHAALDAAGLPRVWGHSARKTCNTILTELKVPVDVRIQILGHASRAINEDVYTETSDVRVIEAMELMDRALDWRQG